MRNTQHTSIPIMKKGKYKGLVDSRQLYEILKIKRYYGEWIKPIVRHFDFVEGVDYVIDIAPPLAENMAGKRNYYLKINMALEVIILTRSKQSLISRRALITHFFQVTNSKKLPLC